MATTTNILNEVELEKGGSICIQVTPWLRGEHRASISIDDHDVSMSIWISIDDLTKLRDQITTTLGELNNGRTTSQDD